MVKKSIFQKDAAPAKNMCSSCALQSDANYKKMYLTLFNRITSAVSHIDRQNYGFAKELLTEAQKETEEMFISSGE